MHPKDGFEVLNCPCSQFAEQTPDSEEETHNFIDREGEITARFETAAVIADVKAKGEKILALLW